MDGGMMVVPYRRTRKKWLCKEWLDSLAESDIQKMLPGSSKPLYVHEIRYLAERSPAAKAIQDQRDNRAAQRALERSLQADEREAQEAEVRERMQAAWEAHRESTAADVRHACYRVGELYFNSPIPRTLKQCIAISASENSVSFGSIQAYLCGVGVRSLTAFKHGDKSYSEDL